VLYPKPKTCLNWKRRFSIQKFKLEMGPANTKEKQWMVFTIAIMPSKFYTKKQ
jgi:hypothetical protein